MPSVTKMLLGGVPASSRAAMIRPPGLGSPITATDAGWSARAAWTTPL